MYMHIYIHIMHTNTHTKQGFGMSCVCVLVLGVLLNSVIGSAMHALEGLRCEVVAYRERLNGYRTSKDWPSDAPRIPIPPYSYTYDVVAMVYTVVEAFYDRGGDVFESLITSMTIAATIASGTVGLAFIWAWVHQFRSYRQLIFQIRDAPRLMDASKYPPVEAGGYVGRQMWSSVLSAMLVYVPVFCLSLALFWSPTQSCIFFYFFLPIIALTVMEGANLALRRTFNKLTVVRGGYIKNRNLFGVYDFLGLFIHLFTGVSLAGTRLIYTYVDFAVSIGRLDRPVLQGKIPHWDAGHTSFMSMAYLDYIYNAPVTSLLAHNLARVMHAREEKKWEDLADVSAPAEARRKQERLKKLNRNRWQLLFTLRSNPEIKKHRVNPPAPMQAWDTDEIREFEGELEECLADWEQRQERIKARMRGIFLRGKDGQKADILELDASEKRGNIRGMYKPPKLVVD